MFTGMGIMKLMEIYQISSIIWSDWFTIENCM